MKKWLPLLFTLAVLASIATASSIKNWSAGDALTSADLNGNFNHIHSLMVGGHGARLVDSDVSGSAGIKFSKLENAALIPKGAFFGTARCSGGTCAGLPLGVISSVTVSGSVYTVNFTPARLNTTYGLIVQAEQTAFIATHPFCHVMDRTTSNVTFECDTAGATGDWVNFTILFYDDA